MKNRMRSKVIKSGNYHWKGVSEKEYKDSNGSHRGVRRFALLGEKEEEQALNFQTRYFEIEAGGYTSFEYHRHPHSVVVIRGSGTVIMGNSLSELDLHDVVYIAPDTLHQFQADRGEPLGFLCIVDRYRDRPVLPDMEEIEERISRAEIRNKIRR